MGVASASDVGPLDPGSRADNGAPTSTRDAATLPGSAPPTTGETPTTTKAVPVVSFDPASVTSDSLPGFEPAATPELDSLTLMASGLGGIGLYALARWRARKRV
jgi:hypothetical protein